MCCGLGVVVVIVVYFQVCSVSVYFQELLVFVMILYRKFDVMENGEVK